MTPGAHSARHSSWNDYYRVGEACRAAPCATAEIQYRVGTDPGAASDAAYTLHAAASALGSGRFAGPLIPTPAPPESRTGTSRHTAAGTSLRRAARLLAATTPAPSDPPLAQIALIFRLAALIEAVAVNGRPPRTVTVDFTTWPGTPIATWPAATPGKEARSSPRGYVRRAAAGSGSLRMVFRWPPGYRWFPA